ncbi:hypothetical protein [Streptomyces iconiensis]|uniref:DUF4190 domain-containing protein n=1 Tax=Streptomyces iconiensis TaxID=1384038 RepID=A0ABT7A5D6_9ACTN|nr:hypothetical protein [Streptomyces iconiensis]MDJ1136530.1 hypothetical protein [Streptomyces iconiensis]
MSHASGNPYPQQPPYPAHGQGPAAQQPRNGLGITALILGLVGALCGLIPFLFWLGGTLGLIGLILGLVGRSRAKKGLATNGKTALSGVLLSLLAFGLGIYGMVVVFTAVDDAVNEMDKELNGAAHPAAVLHLPGR